MAGSMKDALRRAGLAAPAPPPASTRRAKTFREELSDDETLPPPFEAPALTVARIDSPSETPPARAPAVATPESPSPESPSEPELEPESEPERAK